MSKPDKDKTHHERLLCEIYGLLDTELEKDADAGYMSAELREWYDACVKGDKFRQECEARTAARWAEQQKALEAKRAARASGIAKLTKAERKALEIID